MPERLNNDSTKIKDVNKGVEVHGHRYNGDLQSPYDNEAIDISSEDESSSSQQQHHLKLPLRQGISTLVRRPSYIDEEDEPIPTVTAVERANSEPPVTWMSLPNKGQLAVLTFARLSEPLTERSLAAYMFYQLRSFDRNLPDSSIASQGGLLTAAFAAAQFLTAVWWGRAADSAWIGRKRVLLVGLFGTCVSCIGVGFSKSFTQALMFRAMAGALNGNVGVMRTMISEIIQEKKFQSRAFLLLPMCFNIGVVIGPILGGFLADPINSFPSVFGSNSALGGKDGVRWMIEWPYALPNIVSSFFILLSALGVFLGLDETHHALRDKPNYGRKLGVLLVALFSRNKASYRYTRLNDPQIDHDTAIDLEDRHTSTPPRSHSSKPTITSSSPLQSPLPHQKPTIFTRNTLLTLTTHFLLALHISTFNALLFILLPAPRSSTPTHLPFNFTGGLGLTTEKVGLATAIIGIIGFPLQILLYPRLNTSLGTLRSYRIFLPFSALAYTILPYLVLIPATKYLIWPALTLVLSLQVLSRTFSLPSMVILVNNSVAYSEILGTVHGVAQSVSSGARTLGPVVGGWALGLGLKGNCVGAVWWAMAVVAGANWGLLWCIYEGEGVGK